VTEARDIASAPRASWAQIARLAWRESRTARRRLFLYMSTIAVGVAALVSIDSFARNVTRSVREQSRTLLGGDVQITSRHPFPDSVEHWLDSLAKHGIPNVRTTTFPSMAVIPRTGGTRLAQIHGVGAGYPLYGDITTEPAGRYANLQSGPNALVDPALLIATGGRVGDTLTVGYGKFVIAGTLENVPGTSGISAAIGPRVYLPLRYLPETELLVFGSTAEYGALLRLPPTTDPTQFLKPFRPWLRKLEVNTRTTADTEQATERAMQTLASFIGIVGLVALLLGGIGVASGVRAFVARKIDTVAILRCLGASANQVLSMYVVQAALMGLAGAAAGALLGVAVQFALPIAFHDMLPLDVTVQPEPIAIASGLLTGTWIALVFALRPLLALRTVSPLQTLRRDADSTVLRMRWNDLPRMTVNAALVLSVVGVAIARARGWKEGVWMAVATGAVLLALVLVAGALAWIARRTLRRGWPYVVRQGVANVYRPANQTRSVVLSLGFGAFLVTTLFLVQGNLVRDLSLGAAASGANLLLFDVQAAQAPSIDSLIRARGYRVVQQSPIVPMRISAVNGTSVAELTRDTLDKKGPKRARWALTREYRSTYRDSLTSGEQIESGRWFAARMRDTTPLAPGDTGEVSLDKGVAEEMGVNLGDIVTWNVQGVTIPTRVSSLRDVKWTRFEPNFFAVFPTRVLSDAPHQFTVLAAVPGARNVATVQRDIVRLYPSVSSIDLSLVTETIGRIVGKVSTAVRFMALFTLLMAIPVLFSAIAATRRERMRESVLLKTLGATRAQVVRILLTEYAVLGALGALTGFVLARGAGWALIHFMFKGTYSPALLPAAGIGALMVAIAVVIGLLAGREVFRETAMSALRQE